MSLSLVINDNFLLQQSHKPCFLAYAMILPKYKYINRKSIKNLIYINIFPIIYMLYKACLCIGTCGWVLEFWE